MNNLLDILTTSISEPSQLLWTRFIEFLPELIAAIVVLLIGWVIAVGLERLVSQIFTQLKVDKGLHAIGTKTFLKKAGWDFEASDFFGLLVRWTILLVAFLATADILGLDRVTEFISDILGYVPNIFVAVGVLLLGLLAAHFFGGVVKGAVGAAKIKAASFLAGATRWGIYIFTAIIALQQLGIAERFLNWFTVALFSFLALAGGLAFGLGGKEVAKNWLQDLEDEFTHKSE